LFKNTELLPRSSGGDTLALSPREEDDLRNLNFLTTNIAQTLSGTKDGLPHLRAPLQLSLLISPLYLLIPAQLHKKAFSRQLMLSTFEHLGNEKPRILCEVEQAIWKIVFALADGRLSPTQLLKEFAENLPWSSISCLSEDETCWFAMGEDAYYFGIFYIYLFYS
jgi:hypothetical protein